MSSKHLSSYYLGCDISLSRPGFAIIRVENRRAELVATFHIKTNPKFARAARFEDLETELFYKLAAVEAYQFSKLIRESFHSKMPDTNAAVFGAWASVDRALYRCGFEVTEQYTSHQVKKVVAGKGRAEKYEVADAVRRLLTLPADYKFDTDDESDACAIALTYLLKEDLIDEPA